MFKKILAGLLLGVTAFAVGPTTNVATSNNPVMNVAITNPTKINGSTGNITLTAGTNMTIVEAPAKTFTFNASGGGGGITSLTGDVTGTGPGATATTLAQAVNMVYVDFVSGNDTTGTGTLVRPWKTLQKAYNSITPSINIPYTIKVSGGNNDSDGAITAKPNVSIVADYPIQVAPAGFTISGGTTNDGANFSNLIFIGAFSWVRSDNSAFGTSFENTEFFSGPTVQQNGSGSATVTSENAVFVNASFNLHNTGSFFFYTTFLGNTTFADNTSNSYYEFIGGYNSGNMTIAGGVFPAYFAGFVQDVAFGAAMTFTTTGNGAPNVTTDSAGLPPTYTGSPSITFTSEANNIDGAVNTAHGGTGLTSPGTSGNILTSNGTIWTSAAPAASGVSSIGTIDSQSKSANGAVITGSSLVMQSADTSNPGLVTTGTQSFAGQKTFGGNIRAGTTNVYEIGSAASYFINAYLSSTLNLGSSGSSSAGLIRGTNAAGDETMRIDANLVNSSPSGLTGLLGIYNNGSTAGGTRSMVIWTKNDAASNANSTGNINIETGNKTAGTGNSGSINLIVGTSSGGTQGKITTSGAFVLTSYIVANLPSASGSGAGALAFVTDATLGIPAGSGTTVAGGSTNKVPVYSDGTNWIIQ